jgi:hypothetical protein
METEPELMKRQNENAQQRCVPQQRRRISEEPPVAAVAVAAAQSSVVDRRFDIIESTLIELVSALRTLDARLHRCEQALTLGTNQTSCRQYAR